MTNVEESGHEAVALQVMMENTSQVTIQDHAQGPNHVVVSVIRVIIQKVVHLAPNMNGVVGPGPESLKKDVQKTAGVHQR